VVSNSDPADLVHLEGLFDLIVLDAPCSGEGMFRKDPFARAQWSMDLVHQCATTQRGIKIDLVARHTNRRSKIRSYSHYVG
jgi:16S rRNA C967 or C1407 C5-methylase (RsmB/RsmF family)